MMAFLPVILWTDALIFLLLAGIIWFVLYARRHEHLRAPWKKVIESPQGMVAAIVLALYVFIGVLDSLHYRVALPELKSGSSRQYTNEVLSVFDALTYRLRTQVEKTYSAPFATHLYAKESWEAQGKQIRDYPRLKYGGAHLQDLAQRDADIAALAFKGIAKGVFVWLLFVLAVLILAKRKQGTTFGQAASLIWHGKTTLPWRSGLITLGLVLIVSFCAAELAQKYHLFGTDKVGQDVFYQALKSIRTGLVIGTLTTLVTLPIALLLGISAGYFRGWADDVIQYIYTTLNSIPDVLLIAAAVLILQAYMDTHAEAFETISERADLRLLFLCIILGITSWTGLCRLLRGETLKLAEMEYIQAARAFGVKQFKIIAQHILPNVMHIVLITLVLQFSGLVLAEAVLSYVGVGVDPATLSWGNMINSARLEIAREPIVWWPLAAAFVLMFLLVLFANLFSDAVRDAFDPRTQVGRL